MPSRIRYGIDILQQQAALYKNKRIAFVTSNAAITSQGELSRVALLKNGFIITQLFSPEHGITAGGEDGAAQKNHTDAVTGLPVISLYGKQMAPAEEQLQQTDLVLFDIPDAGCRFYTYLWTMTHVMEACAQYNKPLVVADRPNPIGALLQNAEGPMLDETNCSSFIGRWNIPLKHACTLGELARYFAATRIKNPDLQVIQIENYKRHYTALHEFDFIPSSPAMQTVQTAMLYPGTGLLEGINVNEGRGTGNPFQQLGAPWMNGKQLQNFLQPLLKDVTATAVRYVPAAGLYAGQWCEGVQLQVTDEKNFKAVQTGITVIRSLLQLYPEHITERRYHTHANPSGAAHLDKLLGIKDAFKKIQQGESFDLQVNPAWTEMMKPYLLYN